MEIVFLDDKLRMLCEQEKFAIKTLGKPCARKLRSRLADLVADAHVRELVAGRPHPLTGNRQGQFALDLRGGFRLVFKPDHKPVPVYVDGGVNWVQVTRIMIIFIGDYHD